MNRTVTQQRTGGRASRALKTLTAIAAATLLCAAPASAKIIDFETLLPEAFLSGETLQSQGMDMLLVEGPVAAGFNLPPGGTGVLINGASSCDIIACPAAASGTYLAIINDGAVRFTNSDQVGGFMLNAFSLAFMAPITGLQNFEYGLLQLSGNVYGGGVATTTVAFPGQNANGDFMFGNALLDAAFRMNVFTSLTMNACLFNQNGDCVNSFDNPAENQAQFAIDNIDVTKVPEPASFALLGLGAAALGLSRRRRAAKPAVQTATA